MMTGMRDGTKLMYCTKEKKLGRVEVFIEATARYPTRRLDSAVR